MNLLRPILIISALSALTSCNNDCPVDMDAMTGSSSEGGGTTNGCMEAPPLPQCDNDGMCEKNEGAARTAVSAATVTPTRFDTSFAGQYVRADGVLIADGWTGLTSSGPMVPINLDVDGNVNEGGVWTNTDPNGMPTNGMTHCSNWTSNMGVSNYGDSSVNDGMWTAAGTNEGCNGGALLYCFEDR